MKNIEKFEKEISQLVNGGDDIACSIATAAGIVKENSCSTRNCKECQKECLEWMYSEYNEQILSDNEKDIVKSMINGIHKLGCEVDYVIKNDDGYGKAYILLSYLNNLNGYSDCMTTPWFKNNKFKGMEPGKKYTLEELQIELEK